MVKVTISACDICGATPAVTYVVESGTRRARADLCADHGEDVEDFLARWGIGKGSEAPLDVPETSAYRGRVATMEDVQRAKESFLKDNTKRPPAREL